MECLENVTKSANREIIRWACVRKKLSHRYLCTTFVIEQTKYMFKQKG